MRKLLGRLEETVAGVLLAAVAGLICVQLVLMSVAPAWSSPLTTLILALFFWSTMLGIAAATRRRAHLSLVFLSRHVPERWRGALRAVWLVAALVFFAMLAVTGTALCLHLVRWGNSFLGSRCPDWVVTAGVPAAGLLSCIRAVRAWRRRDTEG